MRAVPTYGFTLTIFNPDGTFQGAQYGGPSEPVEDNRETIARLVGNDPTIRPGQYIATLERHRTGACHSQIIWVKAPTANVVEFAERTV
jgi:hypothetical protein